MRVSRLSLGSLAVAIAAYVVALAGGGAAFVLLFLIAYAIAAGLGVAAGGVALVSRRHRVPWLALPAIVLLPVVALMIYGVLRAIGHSN